MSQAKREADPIQGEIVHEYDGILEADNQLPRWWLATFYGAILFAAIYWFWFEAFAVGETTRQRYAAEMAARAAAGGPVDAETLAALGSDPAMVSGGRAVFERNCTTCHGASAEGQVGPNLTDTSWLHGGSPLEIYSTIQAGVPGTAMPPWGDVLGRDGALRVTAYVLSVRNTHVPGRAPEGTVVE